jgi:hypothetical protein
MVLNTRGEESQRYVPSKAKQEEEEEDTDTDTDRNYSHTDRLAKERERERERENWSTKWLGSAKKMRVKREEMMARRGGGARVGSRTCRQRASERASEAMASSSCWLSGSYFWATKFQKKRQQEAELRRRRATRKGDGGGVVRPLGVTSTCFW